MNSSNLATSNPIDPNSASKKDWWRGAVIYQIYPRSFQDSNGDGIGDLQGIIKRLPYVASLGVDAIWISPFFTSPMLDFGYDVSDYCDVDPIFGKLSDFDDLIDCAHSLNIKVMIDLVLSHTSDQHPWFEESRKDKTNPKHDWYVWARAKQVKDSQGNVCGNAPPNNWLSIFGGSAWQWDETRQQYYLHNFLSSQPDLNFHNIAVQDALLDVARFWMDRKVDGFRLDTINFYFHDKQLRDNPILAIEQRNATIAPEVNPYNHQDHQYDKNRPENIVFLKRLRATMEEYPNIAAVGEVGDAQKGMQIMAEYTAGDELIQMCYAFDFLSPEKISARRIKQVIQKFSEYSNDSWSCWAFSNHDVQRHASRWELSEAAIKLTHSLLMSLQGSVCLYQGEELALNESVVSFEDLQDPYGIEFWPKFKGRDGCRTPMLWEDNEQNAGFSSARTWLPVDKDQTAKAVNSQEKQPNSSLFNYRKMIAFRKSNPVLAKGNLHNIQATDSLLSFERSMEDYSVLCIFNLSDQTVQTQLSQLQSERLSPLKLNIRSQELKGLNYQYNYCDDQLELPPWQAFYLLLDARE